MADEKRKIPGMEYWDRYKDEDLHTAFELVKDKADWKMPIDATVPADTDMVLLTDAIIYYTGSVAEYEILGDGRIHVMADGYYNAIGS